MIKDIVVNLSIGDRDPAAEYAVSVASVFSAHLAGVAFAYDPIIPPTNMGEPMPPDWIDAMRTEAEGAAKAAISRFEDRARRAALSAEAGMLNASLVGSSERFARIARRFDLSIVQQAGSDKAATDDLIIEAALFDSGRPVLVVPYIQKDEIKLERVIVCWDGSRNSARAIADALPFLVRAKATEVITVEGTRPENDEIPGADIGHHLSRHGIKVEVDRIVASDLDVANAILSHAADVSADLIVMGGYGHSRLREFILGGATRGILASMTVPTLMSH